jgi:hypothetical protein
LDYCRQRSYHPQKWKFKTIFTAALFNYDGGCPFLTGVDLGWIFFAGLSFLIDTLLYYIS